MRPQHVARPLTTGHPAMNAPNRLLDEVARLVTDAAGAAQGVRREVETVAKTQMQRILADMDVVTREEFEAVREMAIMAREDNDRLAERLAALEAAASAKAKKA
jgi:BMFP domain-containing protein YqiC